MTASPTARRNTRLLVILGGVGGFLFFALVGLRLFVFELFRIPSGSMIPTLSVGDRFVINKLPSSRHRGDVIAFPFPEHPEQAFVKRIIAMDGDTLDVAGGHPMINGWTVPSCKLGEWSYDEPDAYAGSGSHKGELYVEFLENAAYLTFYDKTMFPPHEGPFHSKSGELWGLGDNRNNSHDSRMWFGGMGGGVPVNTVRGTVIGAQGAPRLLASMSSLTAAFDQCMRERPPLAKTTPPPPK